MPDRWRVAARRAVTKLAGSHVSFLIMILLDPLHRGQSETLRESCRRRAAAPVVRRAGLRVCFSVNYPFCCGLA